ncbi:GDP-mannose 4,6-dehydratase, partial [Alphaproteobacteria bacterium]|nr:GDP-mannose 4,6-dehydratase [Alphaproteobacteria bacterium]
LAEFLLERGQEVFGLDNFSTGKVKNIERLKTRFKRQFFFTRGDILSLETLTEVSKGVDCIVHLAAQVSVARSIKFPNETNEINVSGFLNAIQAAAVLKVDSFIYASSCAVYGDNSDFPLKETHDLSPMSPYAASKIANENYASCFKFIAPELKITGLRFFNIFGPWQDYDGGYAAVIPKWIKLLINKKKPVMYGDGSTTRDFCYVENVCDAIYKTSLINKNQSGKVFNICSGQSIRLDELYKQLTIALEKRGFEISSKKPIYMPFRSGEIQHSLGEPKKAKTIIDFDTKICFSKGLDMLLQKEYNI